MPPLNPPVAPGGIINHALRVAPLSGDTVGTIANIVMVDIYIARMVDRPGIE